MKKYIIILVALLCAAHGNAQKSQDVIILNDGTIVKGTISEYIPNGETTIVLADGRIKTFSHEQIKDISENKNRVFSTKEKGYFNSSTIGFLLGNGDGYGSEANFQFNLINGYKMNKFYFGIGTGVETMNGDIFTPIFGDVSYQLNEGKTSPFFTVQGGGTFNFGYDNDHNYYYSNHFEHGKFVGLGFGLKNHINKNLSLLISAGYRYYDLKGDYINDFLIDVNTFASQNVETHAYLHKFNLKLGLMFN